MYMLGPCGQMCKKKKKKVNQAKQSAARWAACGALLPPCGRPLHLHGLLFTRDAHPGFVQTKAG